MSNTIRRTPIVATTYHEAGHVVAAFAYGIPVKHVFIMPDAEQGAAGHVRLGRCRSVDAMHKQGIVALAGVAAQRRYSPRSIRRYQPFFGTSKTPERGCSSLPRKLMCPSQSRP
jgi:hypothetical protein